MEPANNQPFFSTHANFITNIEMDTTPEVFDSWLKANPEYKLEHSYTCYTALSRAAEQLNTKLIKHIIEIGNKNIINTAYKTVESPLILSIYKTAVEENHYSLVLYNAHIDITKLLCDLGADVNKTNLSEIGDSTIGNIPEGSTPLWIAAEKTSNRTLIEMFINMGAIVGNNPLSLEGSRKVKEIKDRLFAQCKQLYLAKIDPQSNFNVFPKEIMDLFIARRHLAKSPTKSVEQLLIDLN